MKNVVYIDGANLYLGIKTLGYELDYKYFYVWLKRKFRVQEAFIFLGYIEEQKNLYAQLKSCGFKLIFKEVLVQDGSVKGNADAEMVLKTVKDFYEEDTKNVVLVSGDGDFSCLVDFLIEKKVFRTLVVPNIKYCSYLLRKKNISMFALSEPQILNKIKSEKTPYRN